MQRPCLELLRADTKTFRLEIQDEVFIGRTCAGSDETKRLIVADKLVSRIHAAVSWSGSKLVITDLSKNGTWVNNIRVSPGSFHTLADGDLIRVGDTMIRVRFQGFTPDPLDDDESTMIATEQVLVSNLVADLRGFAQMSQTQDSSEIYALIRQVFEILSSIVEDCNGTVKDYAGDAVFAFWDHRFGNSQRQSTLACRAALRQVRAIRNIHRKLSGKNKALEHLTLGWGIATGQITLSNYGTGPAGIALVGDSTNLAFRLSDLANKEISNDILLCAETASLVRDVFPLVDLGRLPIRGRSGTEQIFAMKLT